MLQPIDTGRVPRPVKTRLPATVWALGITSFFTDVGSEMIFPLLPLFVSSLGATPAFLGLIEGAAEATSSLLKLGSGYLADRMPRKKPLVMIGYAIAGIVRPLIGLATAPWHVLAVRMSDRVGKGIRSAPRDALIAAAVPREQAGRAFGVHRAMDHAGAVVGPLIATALLAAGWPLRQVFLFAVVPGVLAMIALAVVREAPAAAVASQVAISPRPAPASAAPSSTEPLPSSFYSYLAILFWFSLGASTDALLLLRARDLGVPVALIPTLWMVHHLAKMLATYAGGLLADRYPRTLLTGLGFGAYALSYLGFAFATSAWHVWALFLFYALYYGLSEPTERAMIRDLAPAHMHGRAFGLYHGAIGLSAIPASVFTGWVWQTVSPRMALSLGAAIAGSAALALWMWNARRS